MITASNGYLDGSGVSPYGAHKDHTHDGEGGYAPANHNHDDKYSPIDHNHDSAYEPKNAALLKATKVTIAVADWEEGSASVEMPDGATTYVEYVVDNGSASVAKTAELVLSEVGEESLTFGVTDTPTDAIDLFILYL